MGSFLEKVQNLSQDTRRKIMWLAIGVTMFFIFIFWLFILLPQSPAFEQKNESESLGELKGQLQEGVKGFEEIQKQFSEIKEQYSEEKEQSSHDKTDKEIESGEPRPRLPLEK